MLKLGPWPLFVEHEPYHIQIEVNLQEVKSREGKLYVELDTGDPTEERIPVPSRLSNCSWANVTEIRKEDDPSIVHAMVSSLHAGRTIFVFYMDFANKVVYRESRTIPRGEQATMVFRVSLK